ncbi:MAG TPA: zinc ribbon domain-containing protein [Blastocatellia bacterium]
MHCPHCGAESATGLKFCKRCGGSLIAADASPRKIGTIWALVSSIVAVVVAGLGITFGIAGDLAGRGVKAADGPLEIGVFGSLVVLVTALLLIRLLWKVVTFDLQAQGTQLLPVRRQSLTSVSTTNDLDIVQLSPTLTAPSVTENTTRSFEPRDRWDQRSR